MYSEKNVGLTSWIIGSLVRHWIQTRSFVNQDLYPRIIQDTKSRVHFLHKHVCCNSPRSTLTLTANQRGLLVRDRFCSLFRDHHVKNSTQRIVKTVWGKGIWPREKERPSWFHLINIAGNILSRDIHNLHEAAYI